MDSMNSFHEYPKGAIGGGVVAPHIAQDSLQIVGKFHSILKMGFGNQSHVGLLKSFIEDAHKAEYHAKSSTLGMNDPKAQLLCPIYKENYNEIAEDVL